MMSHGQSVLVRAALLALTLPGCRRDTPEVVRPAAGSVGVTMTRGGDGLLAVEGAVRGEKLLLLLDCGAARSAIDRPVADRLGLSLGPAQSKAVGLGAGGVPLQFTRLPSLQVGALVASAVEVCVLDLTP